MKIKSFYCTDENYDYGLKNTLNTSYATVTLQMNSKIINNYWLRFSVIFRIIKGEVLSVIYSLYNYIIASFFPLDSSIDYIDQCRASHQASGIGKI